MSGTATSMTFKTQYFLSKIFIRLFMKYEILPPRSVFSPPSHLTCVQFNEKDRNILGGACDNGQVDPTQINSCFIFCWLKVCWFDSRVGAQPVGETDFEFSHKEAIYAFNWLGKTGVDLFTGSEDGFIKWWDIRNISKPVR